MKIVPTTDILIEGKHSPAGEVATTSDIIGKALIAQGLAKLPASETAPAPSDEPVAETASAAPAVETAASKRAPKPRTAAPAAK